MSERPTKFFLVNNERGNEQTCCVWVNGLRKLANTFTTNDAKLPVENMRDILLAVGENPLGTRSELIMRMGEFNELTGRLPIRKERKNASKRKRANEPPKLENNFTSNDSKLPVENMRDILLAVGENPLGTRSELSKRMREFNETTGRQPIKKQRKNAANGTRANKPAEFQLYMPPVQQYMPPVQQDMPPVQHDMPFPHWVAEPLNNGGTLTDNNCFYRGPEPLLGPLEMTFTDQFFNHSVLV